MKIIIEYTISGSAETKSAEERITIDDVNKSIPPGARWSNVYVEDMVNGEPEIVAEAIDFCGGCGKAIFDGEDATPAYCGDDCPDDVLCNACSVAWEEEFKRQGSVQ